MCLYTCTRQLRSEHSPAAPVMSSKNQSMCSMRSMRGGLVSCSMLRAMSSPLRGVAAASQESVFTVQPTMPACLPAMPSLRSMRGSTGCCCTEIEQTMLCSITLSQDLRQKFMHGTLCPHVFGQHVTNITGCAAAMRSLRLCGACVQRVERIGACNLCVVDTSACSFLGRWLRL